MYIKLKAAVLALLLLPACALALPLNSYFQQATTIDNNTANILLISDPAVPALTNYPLNSGYTLSAVYSSDQFTVATGQAFNHTINIYSGVDAKLICTVTNDIYITTTSTENKKPKSSNESKCQTSIFETSSKNGLILGFHINVVE